MAPGAVCAYCAKQLLTLLRSIRKRHGHRSNGVLSQCEAEQQTYATHWYEHWIAWVELLVQYTVLHNSPLLECATGS
jgi:hypothetical protein